MKAVHCRGNALLEFTLCSIPLIFVMLGGADVAGNVELPYAQRGHQSNDATASVKRGRLRIAELRPDVGQITPNAHYQVSGCFPVR